MRIQQQRKDFAGVDKNASGWMLLLALIPFVGVILLIVWMVSDGQPMDNEYGAVPTNTL